MDVTLCSNLNAPDAIAHCAFKLTHDIAITPHTPPNNAFYRMEQNWIVWSELRMKHFCFCPFTFELIHGIRMPMVNIPSKGPLVIASRLMVNCNTVPIFCTTITSATQMIPTHTTTERMMQLMAKFDNGFFANGLKKSSNTTADIEFRHVDNELSAALNTPAINRPDNPG